MIKKLIVISILILVPIYILSGCQSNKAEQAIVNASKIKNVIILLIDTLRADHLASYGYSRETAPFLSSLAKKSVVFKQAFSASSTTAPSTASIFTSVYPSHHGIITGYIATQRLARVNKEIVLNKIPAEFVTLGETFKNAGYKTFSLSDNLNISHIMGYDQGFDKFETYQYVGAQKINEVMKSWNVEINSDDVKQKNFIYLHYIDPHLPYHKREPWFKKSTDSLQRNINAYDSEISYLDSNIEKLFNYYHWLDNSLVVVIADHGEEFLEHGKTTHGKDLYREVLHVPFMVYYPSIKARQVEEYVQTLDVLPTLAGLLGLKKDGRWLGKDLTSSIIGKQLANDRPLFSELLRRPEMTQAAFRSVIKNGFHLIENISTHKFELYNLEQDSAEKNNLLNSEKNIAQDLKAAFNILEKHQHEAQKKEVEVKLDEQTLDQLKTLGYVN